MPLMQCFRLFATFIGRSVDVVSKSYLARMSLLYTKMVSIVLMDERGGAQVEEKQARLRLEIRKVRSADERAFVSLSSYVLFTLS